MQRQLLYDVTFLFLGAFFFYSGIVSMRVDRIGTDIPVYDLSVIRSLWEGRVKKYKQRQKKEQDRINKSALTK